MPRSTVSYQDYSALDNDDDDDLQNSTSSFNIPQSPLLARRLRSTRTSDVDLRSRLPARLALDESSSLLANSDIHRSYASNPPTPRQRFSRHHSVTGSLLAKHHSRSASWNIASGLNALNSHRRVGPNPQNMTASKASLFVDERVWYDQFTSTDWVHDSIADGFRVLKLRSRKDIRGKILSWFDGAQGWILSAIIGCLTALLAYFVDVTENSIFDLKEGYCTSGWYFSKRKCCFSMSSCDAWRSWSEVFSDSSVDNEWIDFTAFVIGVVVLALASSVLTLFTKTVVPSNVPLSTLDENLGAERRQTTEDTEEELDQKPHSPTTSTGSGNRPDMVYFSAAGSGVAEVKVILSGFVLHGYLGLKTLVLKTLGLTLSVSSGLSVGKEGPYVHIATCIGNIACRIFSKYHHNDAKRREVLSASAASGVAVAFGAPIGGVLFSLEEVSYYFPPKTLFRTFFSCIAAALSLKFLNPYGTGKIVMFEIRYLGDWQFFEMVVFVLLGVLGGGLGALFIKASKFWAQTFRRIPIIKRWPLLEVFLVALITGIVSFWNRYTKLAVAELLYELAAPCDATSKTGLCPAAEEIPHIIRYLCVAFIIKSLLTTITFGIKVPAGIYVPSMVVGGLMGRIVGHMVQYLVIKYPDAGIFGGCPVGGGPESCITPGVYALIAAGATMCGVTRLSVTLAVILFELTGSLNHVLPFSIAVLVSKWTADALEPLSIYDLLTDMNAYPFLDNRRHPVFVTELKDITPHPRQERLIDISSSPLVHAPELRQKLEYVHMAGELDGGLPIIRNGILVGLIPAPDLEFALDKLDDEENALCLMAPNIPFLGPDHMEGGGAGSPEDGSNLSVDQTDFTPYIDPAPVTLDIHSPMDLVYQCFVKLGLRYICVLNQGLYAGMVHKKRFVKYVKELEAEEI
ncbi:MAG: hypothetical protein M1834_009025 [Cirrosporium novae-zelandiae]|nr:MAG: hypothetical protein M1834_009025 [Cirrosporium novae-zelandiae]